MLRFAIHPGGLASKGIHLPGAYVVGSDGVPLRAEIEYKDQQIRLVKRAEGPAGLALLWPVPGAGYLMMETSRLLEREQPYSLSMELVRGRLMRMSHKREEWGLFDFDGIQPVAAEIDRARDLFVQALKADSLATQSTFADEALKVATIAGEQLSHFHAELFLNRRKQAHAFTKRVIGCTIDLANHSEEYRKRFVGAFDYAYLPLPWRLLEPKQQEFNWRPFDMWVEFLAKNRIPIKVGPLVSFHEGHVPDWLSMYETDFEVIRNMVFDHVRRVVERYGNYVHHWDVVSGVHAENIFGFTFEQLMELTRVTVLLVKQLAQRAQAVIDLVMPWGEYYARNQRTIPPMLYADMVVQSGVGFDGLGVQFLFGAGEDGMYVRDMLQISEKLDRLGNLGKPLHITAVQVPSATASEDLAGGGGCWRKPWNEQVQARWIKEFYTIALSKPFVDSITWMDLADRTGERVRPYGGLFNADLTPKAAFKVVKDIRAELLSMHRKPPSAARSE